MNKSNFLDNMTQKQKQAAIVCAVCALAVIVTLCVTLALVSKKANSGSNVDESSIALQDDYDSTAYVVDVNSVLAETDDAGDDYVKDTLFIGDSNTVRMYNNGLITMQQFCAEDGLGIQDAATKQIVAFKGDSNMYTIPDAVALMKPRRVLITLGTNNCDGSMSKDDFISDYRTLIQTIQSKYSYTDIIVNAIPPIPASHDNYPSANQGTIDEYNMALADLCKEMNVEFLNSVEALKDENGYGNSSYYVENDVHFTMNGLKSLLKYYRTHAYTSEDKRPDTSNVPTRTQSFTSANNNSGGNSAKPTLEPSPTASASKFTASYYVDSSGGGTLTCGTDKGKTSLVYDVTEETNSFTVTAVPNDGYFFLKWSDGTKTAQRTDVDFNKNVNVTAVFGTISITISEDKGRTTAVTGEGLAYTAKLSSNKYGSTDDIIWYANDVQVETGEHGTFRLDTAGNYSIYAAITVNGVTVKSKALGITITNATAVPAPTAVPTASPAPASITINPSTTQCSPGGTVNFSVAATAGTYDTIKWYVNGADSGVSGTSFSYTRPDAGTTVITAVLFLNGAQVSDTSNQVTVNFS